MKHIYILSCVKDGGIYHYLFENGKLDFVQKTPLDSPMYAVVRNEKMYVVLREIDANTRFGGILSFDIDENGNLINPTGIQSTDGIVPCHLEVTDEGQYVVNYLSGNIVKIGKKTVTHSGKGINPKRQEAPHTHFVSVLPDKKHLACVDLGVDKIFIYDEDLNEITNIRLPDGSGPRHLCFDDNYIYCVTELSNDVCVIKDFELIGVYPALDKYKGESLGAAIRKKDDMLYVSNRGANTISRFKAVGDELTLIDNTCCGGNWPRDFEIVDDYIICTNEYSNSVTVLKLQDGKLVLCDETIEIDSPLCVAVYTKNI